jgi:hypothetical protein
MKAIYFITLMKIFANNSQYKKKVRFLYLQKIKLTWIEQNEILESQVLGVLQVGRFKVTHTAHQRLGYLG